MIKEVIVVEGKDDISAVKNAIDCDCIATHGYKIKKSLFDELRKLKELRGIIIFTDPDYAGKRIRRILDENIKGAKHAYLPQKSAIKSGDIGVENASKEDIVRAIMNAKAEKFEKKIIYSTADFYEDGLLGRENSKKKREELSKILCISDSNAKKMIQSLNIFQIDKEEYKKALRSIND